MFYDTFAMLLRPKHVFYMYFEASNGPTGPTWLKSTYFWPGGLSQVVPGAPQPQNLEPFDLNLGPGAKTANPSTLYWPVEASQPQNLEPFGPKLTPRAKNPNPSTLYLPWRLKSSPGVSNPGFWIPGGLNPSLEVPLPGPQKCSYARLTPK